MRQGELWRTEARMEDYPEAFVYSYLFILICLFFLVDTVDTSEQMDRGS
jgi:hypothetical protein